MQSMKTDSQPQQLSEGGNMAQKKTIPIKKKLCEK